MDEFIARVEQVFVFENGQANQEGEGSDTLWDLTCDTMWDLARRAIDQLESLSWWRKSNKSYRWVTWFGFLGEEYRTRGQRINIEDDAVETAEAPKDLTLSLLKHQKAWLAWSLKQEESLCRGGILADEMGMGKTIEAIALVLKRREVLGPLLIQKQAICLSEGSLSKNSAGELPEINSTLVICPKAALPQWQNEIIRSTRPGSTKVLIYHGRNKKTTHDFSLYDFVLTTYSTVEVEYRKVRVEESKVRCKLCRNLCFVDSMAIHLSCFCKNKHLRKEGSVLDESFESRLIATKQSKEGIDGNNSMDGEKRMLKQFEDEMKGGRHCLHSFMWLRIILDEAHHIKNKDQSTSKAVFALESSYRWALTGTPIQNSSEDVHSLVSSLPVTESCVRVTVTPSLLFAFFLKNSGALVIMANILPGGIEHCGREKLQLCNSLWLEEASVTTHIKKPIRRGSPSEREASFLVFKHIILKGIMLRRTMKTRASDIKLPLMIVKVRRDALSAGEEDFYKTLYGACQSDFNNYVAEGNLMNSSIHLLALITRLRQALDHRYLVTLSEAEDDDQKCGICTQAADSPVLTPCKHVFCNDCLNNYTEHLGVPSCPSCDRRLPSDLKPNGRPRPSKRKAPILSKIRLEEFQTSTKIDALKEEIRFMLEDVGSAKAIVFSQFSSFLELINYSLHKSGINCLQLVGGMTPTRSEAVITTFNDDPDCRILLISLKSGGCALNLTVASNRNRKLDGLIYYESLRNIHAILQDPGAYSTTSPLREEQIFIHAAVWLVEGRDVI
ncbi:Zinc finger, C3HC4 RING-type [Dillenia turbinata]|uniref:Zinc finger, C3HC4 RING-type n=1 Tax=Dillenia turbinata TaxID=194707 RepID=A0AAN8YYG8_9MAGN